MQDMKSELAMRVICLLFVLLKPILLVFYRDKKKREVKLLNRAEKIRSHEGKDEKQSHLHEGLAL